jgi:hypothetical protein
VMGAIVTASVTAPTGDSRALVQFVDGIHRALYVAAGVAFAAAVIAVATVRKVRQAEPHAIPEAA